MPVFSQARGVIETAYRVYNATSVPQAIKSLVVGVVFDCTPLGGSMKLWYQCSIFVAEFGLMIVYPSPVTIGTTLKTLSQLIEFHAIVE
jgi:hypothetical protein